MTTINDKNVGDIVLIDDMVKKGAEYIVVHKGVPSSDYDNTYDGVWLMRKNVIPDKKYDEESKGNDFVESTMYYYLNVTFYLNSDIINKVRYLRVPYYKGNTPGGSVQTGANGYGNYLFLLSSNEIGFSSSYNSNVTDIGSVLDYFKSASKASRYDSGSLATWWLRTPVKTTGDLAFYIDTDGSLKTSRISIARGVRPAMVVYRDCFVDENNYLKGRNAAPVITADKSGNLGTLTDGFTCNFSIDDVNASDTLSTTLKLNDTVIRSFAAVRNQQETFALVGTDWIKTPNGTHSFSITVSDGKATVTKTASFTRNCTSLSLALAPPLSTKSLCTACNLKIVGIIPQDAEIKCEACNNANDDQPAWEDITAVLRSGLAHLFKNKTAKNGYAVNLRITSQRGSSNTGGFIDKIIFCYE